jgi:hypothetical protein
MEKGFVAISAGTFHYIISAFVKPYCAFYPVEGNKEVKVVESSRQYTLAYRCTKCNVFVIDNVFYNPNYPTPPGFVEVPEGENDPGVTI